jgi:hypothetical protein
MEAQGCSIDHHATKVLINNLLEHCNDMYCVWLMHVHELTHALLHALQQGEHLAWIKLHFVLNTERSGLQPACNLGTVCTTPSHHFSPLIA